MIAFWIIIIVMCTLHLQGFCREDFILASDYSNFYIRTIESTASFTSFRKPDLVGPFGHGSMLDTAYDPATDKFYWIERLWISQSEPKNCPTTIAIGRCDFDGTNSERINNGTQCITTVNSALLLDTKYRLLYWSSMYIDGSISLQRSTIEGTDIHTIDEIAHGHGFYTDITIDERFGDIYWLAGANIHKISLGGDIEVFKREPFSQSVISSIAVDSLGNLFWTTSLPATVSRSTLKGDNARILFQALDESFQFARDISLYKDSIYFVQSTENQSSTDSDIYQMNKDDIMPPVVQPIDFSLTSLHIYSTTDISLVTSTIQDSKVQTTLMHTDNQQQIMYITLVIALCILVVVVIVSVIYHRIKYRNRTQNGNRENSTIHHTYFGRTTDPKINTNAIHIDDGYDHDDDPLYTEIGDTEIHDQSISSEDYDQPYDSHDTDLTPGSTSNINANGDNSAVNEDYESSLVINANENSNTSFVTNANENSNTSLVSSANENSNTSLVSNANENSNTSLVSSANESSNTYLVTNANENSKTSLVTNANENSNTSFVSIANESSNTSLVTNANENSNTVDNAKDQEDFESNMYMYEQYIEEPSQFYDFVPDFSED